MFPIDVKNIFKLKDNNEVAMKKDAAFMFK